MAPPEELSHCLQYPDGRHAERDLAATAMPSSSAGLASNARFIAAERPRRLAKLTGREMQK